MTRVTKRRRIAAGLAAAASATIAGVVASAQLMGPSSSQTPYVLPVVPAVKTSSILTVGDSIGGYKLVGLPDGLGAFDNGNGTFTVLMNHEVGSTAGLTHAHGSKGSFVSKWVINKSTLSVISGSDLMQRVFPWDTANQRSFATHSTFAFTRFCSGDLPEKSAFYNASTGLGTQERIYMHGEESGPTGYQQATIVTGRNAGDSFVLGKFNLATNGSGLTGVGGWENALANPYPQDKTLVVATNDGGTGIMNNSVAVYVGHKQTSGTEVDKAGLTNGALTFINVAGNATEISDSTTRTTNIASGTRFTLNGTTSTTFSRPEDGAWNPLNLKQFYFVTTDRLDQVTEGIGTQIGRTRLWRLTFDDLGNPYLGGTIDLLIDGRVVDGQRVNMFDNIGVNAQSGQIVLQEDPGGTAHNAKVWLYDPATDVLVLVAKHDVARFGDIGVAATAPYTNDEESSGAIDMGSILGLGYYLIVDQAHYPTTTELVEGGQMLLARIPLVTNKDQCKKGGYSAYLRNDGTGFKNQGDCIQYANTGK